MKKIYTLFILLTTIASLTLQPVIAKAASTNLIANPSMETAASGGTMPANWQNGSWGENAVQFIYNTSGGQNGNKSVTVKISNYVNGDAKWYFDPITLQANAEYVFSDYYLSTTNSEVVIAYTNSLNQDSYVSLGNTAASASWKKTNFVFTTPADVKTATIYHLLNGNGSLTIDNFSLTKSPSVVITNGVPNNSVEQSSPSNPNMPLAWQADGWGTNTASFVYSAGGHTGSKSLKVNISKYTDGDAKWYFAPQPVTGGQYYRFTDYYKSNISSEVVVAGYSSDGSVVYIPAKSAAPATNWTKYSDVVAIPAGVTTATVFHLLAGVGSLTTDDFSFVLEKPSTFKRPIITLDFDDGYKSVYTNAFPLLKKYNMVSSDYIISSYVGLNSYMNAQEILALKNAGNEIGSHSVSHPFLTQLAPDMLTFELNQSKINLQNLFGPVVGFATPYDDYNALTIAAAKKYYQYNRISDEGYNAKPTFDPYMIKTKNVTSATTTADVKSWVDEAARNNYWLVILYHEVENNNDVYNITPANFEQNLIDIKNSGIAVMTTQKALSELRLQMLIGLDFNFTPTLKVKPLAYYAE